jgi:lysophospholipase L1-like esterase
MLLERWDQDCLELEPDYVTILIGVNNTLHRFKRGIVTTASEFDESYRAIVEKTMKNPEIKLTIMEPFILPVEREDKRLAFVTSMQIWEDMREDLNEKIHIIRKIAREYAIKYIALDGIFSELSVIKSCEFWLHDGVHPTQVGHAVIAEQWLNKAGSL